MFKMFKPRVTRLLKIGKSVAVDPSEISALYIQDHELVIRLGVGIIRLKPEQLFFPIQKTIDDLVAINSERNSK